VAEKSFRIEFFGQLNRALSGAARKNVAAMPFEEQAKQQGERWVVIYDQDFQHSRVDPVFTYHRCGLTFRKEWGVVKLDYQSHNHVGRKKLTPPYIFSQDGAHVEAAVKSKLI